MPTSEPTLDLWSKTQALINVWADAAQTQAEHRVTVVLVRPAGSVAHVQFVAALRHGWDSQVELPGEERAGDGQVETVQLSEVGTETFLPGIPSWRSRSHLAVRAGSQAEAEEVLLGRGYFIFA